MIPQNAVAMKSNNRVCYLGSMMVEMWRDRSFLTSVQRYYVLGRYGFHYIGVGSQRHTFSMVLTDVFQLYADVLGRWNGTLKIEINQSEINMLRFEGPGKEILQEQSKQKTSKYTRVIDSFLKLVLPIQNLPKRDGFLL